MDWYDDVSSSCLQLPIITDGNRMEMVGCHPYILSRILVKTSQFPPVTDYKCK